MAILHSKSISIDKCWILEYITAPCGSTGIVQAIETKQTLSSPNYPAAPGTNLRCRWLIDGNSSAVQIHFQHISIGSTDSAQQCTQDRLEVQDVVNVSYIKSIFFSYRHTVFAWLYLHEFENWVEILQAGTSQEANGNLVVNGDGGEIVRLNQHRLLIQVYGDVVTFNKWSRNKFKDYHLDFNVFCRHKERAGSTSNLLRFAFATRHHLIWRSTSCHFDHRIIYRIFGRFPTTVLVSLWVVLFVIFLVGSLR